MLQFKVLHDDDEHEVFNELINSVKTDVEQF